MHGHDPSPRPPSEPFARAAPATAVHLGVLRRALRVWLVAWLSGWPDDDTVADLILAMSEALENAADHAFTGCPAPGTMAVSAEVDDLHVVITITDDGRWRPPRPGPGYRRRGLALMGHLVHHYTVHTGTAGTTVVLARHRDRPSRRPASAG